MWKHVKNGKVVVKAELNNKTKTYILFFEDGEKLACASTTFKRWYKEIEPEVNDTDEVTEQKKEIDADCPSKDTFEDDDTAGDGTPLAEVGKEIAKQAKQKAVKAKAPKKDISEFLTTVIDTLTKLNLVIKTYPGDPRTIVVKTDVGKAIGTVRLGNSKFSFNTRQDLVPEGYKADRVRNCPNSHAFDINYTDINKLTELVNAIKEEK